MRVISACLQVILLSDGSVTRHLQLMTNQRVQVRQAAWLRGCQLAA
jgi:chorismate-pyruvate lyase